MPDMRRIADQQTKFGKQFRSRLNMADAYLLDYWQCPPGAQLRDQRVATSIHWNRNELYLAVHNDRDDPVRP